MDLTVKNLIKLLQDQNQESIVVLSSDPEGNRYRTVDAISDEGFYREDGEIRGGDDLLQEMEDQEYTNEEKARALKDWRPCLVFYPN